MIQVICKDQKIIYSAYHLVKAFYPETEVKSLLDATQPHRILVQEQLPDAAPQAKEQPPVCILTADDIRTLYQKLRERTGTELPWGMLTGVRPVKIASQWISEQTDERAGEEDFAAWFRKERFVSAEKASLAFRVAVKERELIRRIAGEEADASSGYPWIPGYSLYIGIPFCPSICSYCSFSSGDIRQYQNRVDAYLQALIREMQERKAQQGEEFPTTVYMGGGTPSSLSAAQLKLLLKHADRIWQIRQGLAQGRILEFTVEAGRPDSITAEKLEVLKEYGVTRISINPQTMQQKTLDLIGRKHTAEEIRSAYKMAREMGFSNINMDLIMGLPGESGDDARDTLQQIQAMNPDSLTVHSLAVKRASRIGMLQSSRGEYLPAARDITEMIQNAYDTAGSMGMEPYYLYRQKSIAGNFENIGYANPGKEGLYNILIMEEVQSILACGAGASSKIVHETAVPNPARKGQLTYMTRSENVKNIEEYIKRFLHSEEKEEQNGADR